MGVAVTVAGQGVAVCDYQAVGKNMIMESDQRRYAEPDYRKHHQDCSQFDEAVSEPT